MFRTPVSRGIVGLKQSYSISSRLNGKRVLSKTRSGIRRMATAGTGHLNRLATAKSPYLRQHATNPVDWYPFEKAALDKAKARSEEHTSELQSQSNLVCRLLLE